MNWLNKLERKLGKFSIRNLSLWIIVCYVIGYLITFLSPQLLNYLRLEPQMILQGQIWRLFTWILIPPSSFGIFTFVMLFFYYSLGTTLETTWGKFRYNAYILSGFLLTIVGAFIVYFIYILQGYSSVTGIGYVFSTYYVNLSIFLAFAANYPDMQVMLYFVIPVKIKWMAWLDIAILAFDIVRSGFQWELIVVIVASLANFLIFFLSTRNYKRVSPREIHRKQEFKRQVHKAPTITKHKCAICGRTDEDSPELEFRFCSKCNGNYEYCQNHLFTHEHRK